MHGWRGLAGHVGQVPILTSQTQYQTLEEVASGFATAAAARKTGQEVDARDVYAAAKAGQSWAEDIIDSAVNHLAA